MEKIPKPIINVSVNPVFIIIFKIGSYYAKPLRIITLMVLRFNV